MNVETPLLEARPSWWNFFWHLFFFWLIVPPIIALVKHHETILRVYEDRVSLEQGIIRKELTDLFIVDIRAVELKQGIWQRTFGVGDLLIGTAATEGWEDYVRGLPHARDVRDLILSQRRKLTNQSR